MLAGLRRYPEFLHARQRQSLSSGTFQYHVERTHVPVPNVYKREGNLGKSDQTAQSGRAGDCRSLGRCLESDRADLFPPGQVSRVRGTKNLTNQNMIVVDDDSWAEQYYDRGPVGLR